MASQPTLPVSFRQSAVLNQVTAAEVYFTTFIAEHSILFLATDHFTKLCRVMFPDSQRAKEFALGRTKTTAIVKHALAPALNSEVVQQCQSSPYTILYDGGNDQIDKKYFAIMVRLWNEAARQPVTRFLAMPTCNVSTAEALLMPWQKSLSHTV